MSAAVFCDECGTELAGASRCFSCGTTVTALPRFPYRDRLARAARTGARRLGAIARHNRLGSIAGLFAAWFNVPLVLLMAAVGAFFGGVVGLFSGGLGGPGALDRFGALFSLLVPMPVGIQDLLPTAAVQIGGIIGALIGIVTGAFNMAWMTFFGFWWLLYEGDPLWPLIVMLGQIATAVFVGALYTFYSSRTESWRLHLAGGRRPSRREAALLVPMLRQAARRMGISDLPTLIIDDRCAPNATAWMHHIVVNTGLLKFLAYDRNAVAGVLAHELAHWHRGDAAVMAWGKGLAFPLYLAHVFAVRVQEATRWGPLRVLLWIVLWSVSATMRGLVVPLHARYWRECEYAADAAAARAGYADGLHHALDTLRRTFDGARDGWDQTMLATHPPTELRLERLERAGRTYPLVQARSTAHVITRSGPHLPRPEKN